MKAQRVKQWYSSTFFLTSLLHGVNVQLYTPVALPPGKEPGTHCIGGWLSPMAGLHVLRLHELQLALSTRLEAGTDGKVTYSL